jgi:hypothetical protein
MSITLITDKFFNIPSDTSVEKSYASNNNLTFAWAFDD